VRSPCLLLLPAVLTLAAVSCGPTDRSAVGSDEPADVAFVAASDSHYDAFGNEDRKFVLPLPQAEG